MLITSEFGTRAPVGCTSVIVDVGGHVRDALV